MLSQCRTTLEEQPTSTNLYSAFVEFLNMEYAAYPYKTHGVLPEALQQYLIYLKSEGTIKEYKFKRIKNYNYALSQVSPDALITLSYRTLTDPTVLYRTLPTLPLLSYPTLPYPTLYLVELDDILAGMSGGQFTMANIGVKPSAPRVQGQFGANEPVYPR